MSADLFLTDRAFIKQNDNGRLKFLTKGKRFTTMRLDEFLDRIDGGVFQIPCEQSVDKLSLFSGPGLSLNTKSPTSKQWNVAVEFE